MVDQLKFVVLDDKTHIIGAGEYTACGLVIPQGLEYTTSADELCSECRKRATDTDEFGAGDLPSDKRAKATKEAPTAKEKDLSVTITVAKTPAEKDLSVTVAGKDKAKSGSKA